MLFANGYAIYKFTADKGSESQCYGECAEAWPPLDARGEVVADDVTEFGGDWLAVKRNGAAAPH